MFVGMQKVTQNFKTLKFYIIIIILLPILIYCLSCFEKTHELKQGYVVSVTPVSIPVPSVRGTGGNRIRPNSQILTVQFEYSHETTEVLYNADNGKIDEGQIINIARITNFLGREKHIVIKQK